MTKSHATGWASDAPTPAQMKELFAQIDSGRVTKKRLQAFLRGEEVKTEEERPDVWLRRKGFIPTDHSGVELSGPLDFGAVGVLLQIEDTRLIRIKKLRRPWVATIWWQDFEGCHVKADEQNWLIRVNGREHFDRISELAAEMREFYSVNIRVELAAGELDLERIPNDFRQF